MKNLIQFLIPIGLWASLAAYAQESDVATTPQDVEQFMPSPPVPAAAPQRHSRSLKRRERQNNEEQWETFFGKLIVRNVTTPAIFSFFPATEKRNGRSILVLPGGGYQFISMENEGFPVAERLADVGYSVFVLKYRTQKTPVKPDEFLEEAGKIFSQLGKQRLPDYLPAVEDLLEAKTLIQEECIQMGCDGNAVGVIGFSAGARTIIRALEDTETDFDPNSIALIYPPTLDPIGVKPEASLFLAIAQDDPLFQQGGFNLPDAWVNAGGSIEFHLYNAGGHGFGVTTTGNTSENWLNAYIAWLNEQY